MNSQLIIDAYNSQDIKYFLDILFPEEWKSIAARIVETGAEFSTNMCDWAPKWSKIPLTVKKGKTELEVAVKSCIYRVHDCIHQLWGLPIQGINFSQEDFYSYKRAQMCGEVAVLTLTEFAFVKHLMMTFSDIESILMKRNAIPMMNGPLAGKSILQIALRLDSLLHKKICPKWVRDMPEAMNFVNDYVPMLENDRKTIDHNWNLMKKLNWYPDGAPNSRYNLNLDGLELTTWMINDFFHLIDTDPIIDENLRLFNKSRREKIILPNGWNNVNS